MKKIYLFLSFIGFIVPNILVVIETVESGNIMLYADPTATFEGMFTNRISTIFAIDLLISVLVFFIWTYVDGRRKGVKKIGLVWILTMLFGLAGALPLYLYYREKAISDPSTDSQSSSANT